MTAYVLGNGTSRQSIDPADLTRSGKVYGCNALYRTFAPDVLVSTDTPISEAIQNSGYSQTHTHYTRRPLPNLGALKLPSKYYGYSSGPAAVGLAAEAGHHRIYLLGFDLGGNQLGMFNNMYADTEFYKKSSSVPTYSGNWIRQIAAIAKEFDGVEFVRVMGTTTAEIQEFARIANITCLPLADFADRINNKKDF
jgi:hypothetical protein